MKKCAICGSMQFNKNVRSDDKYNDLCDVHYWKQKAETGMKRPEKKDYPSSIDFMRAQMDYYKQRTNELDRELAELKEVLAAIESETKPDDWECEW